MIKDLFFYIYYCNGRKLTETCRPLRKITRTLQHHELVFVSDGSGSIVIGEKRYPIHRGMLFYICPDISFTIEPKDPSPAQFLTVHFSYAHVCFSEGKWDIRDEAQILPLHPAQELKDYYPIEALFKELVDSWNAKLPGYEFISRTLLQQLFVAIHRNLKKQDRNYSISLKVDHIIQYMHQNSNQQVTLDELSKMVQLSSFYLSRAFKEITGYSIIAYFNKIKIDKAKELLADGDKKVKDVARELGYADEFYFSRMFKRMEGMSPSEFHSKIVHDI